MDEQNEQIEKISGNIHTEIFTEETNAFQCKKFFLTYHLKENETKDQVFKNLEYLGEVCEKYIFAEEYGKSGNTPHIQGAFILKAKMRATTVAKYFKNGCTLRKLKNWNSAFNYCLKEGNRILTNVKIPKPIKIIENLYDWQKRIEKLFLEEVDERKIYWFWEQKGNIGKSAFIKYMIVKHKVLYCSGGKYTDIMNLVFNQNMDDCRGVFFDIPRANLGNISYASLENIKNGMICNTKYETGVKVFNSPHIFVFANARPDCLDKLSLDRWVIEELC